ncbi:hypothetical protein BDR07DRAFT_1283888 [Suillus spraguei]|nr:hypothetical protein BDR07DRAFT_1283888 [Suillus spraguei]
MYQARSCLHLVCGATEYQRLTILRSPLCRNLWDHPGVAPFQRRDHIPFYNKHEPYHGFTDFLPHDVVYTGKRYPTGEHLFQSFKVILNSRLAIAEHIRKCGDGPSTVFDEAHRHEKWVRSDWKQVNTEKMEVTLRLKSTLHTYLKVLLLGTAYAELVEDSPKDFLWIGADSSGHNELRKALERVRDELSEYSFTNIHNYPDVKDTMTNQIGCLPVFVARTDVAGCCDSRKTPNPNLATLFRCFARHGKKHAFGSTTSTSIPSITAFLLCSHRHGSQRLLLTLGYARFVDALLDFTLL